METLLNVVSDQLVQHLDQKSNKGQLRQDILTLRLLASYIDANTETRFERLLNTNTHKLVERWVKYLSDPEVNENELQELKEKVKVILDYLRIQKQTTLAFTLFFFTLASVNQAIHLRLSK